MKNKRVMITLLLLVMHMAMAQAQIWKKVQQKLEDKVEKKVDDVLNGQGAKNTEEEAESASLPNLEEVYSFTPGDHILFADDFKTSDDGRMAKHWKTSGGGSVVSISGVPGKWLLLAPYTTYRMDSLLNLPENFTVEFDLVTRSVEAKDIGSMNFGFGRDNSNRSYIMDAYNDNAITSSQFHFHNREVTNASSDTEIYNTLKFPFNSYSNGLIHVAIAVEGKRMRLFVNKSKMLDTDMFKPEAVKYFYLSAPFSYDADAKVFLGNVVVAQ